MPGYNAGMGIPYDDVKKRMKRIAANREADRQKKSNLMESLCNQVRLRDGEGGVREINREVEAHLADERRRDRKWI